MIVRVVPTRPTVAVVVVVFACLMCGSAALAQAPLPIPVFRAQFESNLSQLYSYAIAESTRSERVTVAAWDGGNHRLVRWAGNGKNEQRFAVVPEPGGKVRLRSLREDVNDRLFVTIRGDGAAVTWPKTDDGSQVFQIEWQPDGLNFALREGTKGEFVDVSAGGGVLRWSGVDGKNEKPKPNQLFQFWAPHLEGPVAGSPLLSAYAGRGLGESCVGFVPCAAGLSCHPGVLKCFSVPRWQDEPCILGGPFDCDVTMQCASPEQVCKTIDDRTSNAYCDGFTYQCAQGYHCKFDWFLGTVPLAQSGRCVAGLGRELNAYDWPPQPSAPLLYPYSRNDSEGDPLFAASAWRIFEGCTPSQLMVGLTVTTRYFASVETARGKRLGWTTLGNIKPICVETNKDLGWAGPVLNEQPQTPSNVEGVLGSTSLKCAPGSFLKGIHTTSGRDLFPEWNESNYIYSLQVECSDGKTLPPVGGYSTEEIARALGVPAEAQLASVGKADLNCPSWRFVPQGLAYNGQGYPTGKELGGRNLQLKTSSVPAKGERAFQRADNGVFGAENQWLEPNWNGSREVIQDPIVTIFRDLVLMCGYTETIKGAGEAAIAARAGGTPPAPPTLKLEGATPVSPTADAAISKLEGTWSMYKGNGEKFDKRATIARTGDKLAIDNGYGSKSTGVVTGRRLTTSDGLTGILSFDGTRIRWNVDIYWVREPAAGAGTAPTAMAPTSSPAAGAAPRLEGSWAMYKGNGEKFDRLARVVQDGPSLAIDNGYGSKSKGTLTGRTLTTSDGLTGTVSADGKTIDWNVDIRWVKETTAATVSPAAPATPPTAPAPTSTSAGRTCDADKENLCRSLLQDQVPWTTAAKDDPSVRHWQPANLDLLCRCTTNPPATVLCFQNALVSNGNSWLAAINSCKAP